MGENSLRTRGRVVARAGGLNAAARDNAPMAKMDRIVLQWVDAHGCSQQQYKLFDELMSYQAAAEAGEMPKAGRKLPASALQDSSKRRRGQNSLVQLT